jgi:trans-aconitate methyltransferase
MQMSSQTTNAYSLGHTPQEYERLRLQARVWEAATGRLLDHVGLAAGARCLDAGCGPGETMRLMAHRVGPTGQVVGIDIDTALGELTQAMLHDAGHRHCLVLAHDVSHDEPIPGGPYDLVYARLLVFHLPQRVAVLRRLWDAVAPGGHLLVQDYDISKAGPAPSFASVEEAMRVLTEAFEKAGCDIRIGMRLPELMVAAGIGTPDGTDVAGRLEPLGTGRTILETTYRSLLPLALAHGITSPEQSEATLAALDRDATEHADLSMLWPLLLGAWKRKDRA